MQLILEKIVWKERSQTKNKALDITIKKKTNNNKFKD